MREGLAVGRGHCRRAAGLEVEALHSLVVEGIGLVADLVAHRRIDLVVDRAEERSSLVQNLLVAATLGLEEDLEVGRNLAASAAVVEIVRTCKRCDLADLVVVLLVVRSLGCMTSRL